ncbi:hypothetical protein GH741_12710 [Aquibacillus halophilus]|uniref:Uncharacterized protein n=1 Tax=Aquibacillus halophilus TaxID=930132 RepID=A0A6A8DIG1_9BACI|nr:hypothetical protein [Aquibacillus halophilus]MRH43541.1 hypothetical protein [Aquibacillus halophilus]
MKQTMVSSSLIFLGVCILIGAWVVSSAIKTVAMPQSGVQEVHINEEVDTQLMSHMGLQEYLGIQDNELDLILPELDDEGRLNSKLPYIQIGSSIYFPVKAINNWLADVEAETFK